MGIVSPLVALHVGARQAIYQVLAARATADLQTWITEVQADPRLQGNAALLACAAEVLRQLRPPDAPPAAGLYTPQEGERLAVEALRVQLYALHRYLDDVIDSRLCRGRSNPALKAFARRAVRQVVELEGAAIARWGTGEQLHPHRHQEAS